MKKTIIVKDVINSSFAVSADKGTILKEAILKDFDNFDQIILDFKDIKAIITAFLNEAYGGLFYKKNKISIRNKIKFENLTETTEKLLVTVDHLIDIYFKEDESHESY